MGYSAPAKRSRRHPRRSFAGSSRRRVLARRPACGPAPPASSRRSSRSSCCATGLRRHGSRRWRSSEAWPPPWSSSKSPSTEAISTRRPDCPSSRCDRSTRRVTQKLVGFWLTIGALAAAYCLLPPYATDFFAPFREAALWCLPALVVFSPFYIALVDQRQASRSTPTRKLPRCSAAHVRPIGRRCGSTPGDGSSKGSFCR